MLQNADTTTLGVAQIAAHLRTKPWNITNELARGRKNEPGRLRGEKKLGPGSRGSGGQWQVDRTAYLDWLGVPEADRTVLGPGGLPVLYDEQAAGELLGIKAVQVRAVLLRLGVPYLMVGWRRYLTHHQMERLRVLLAEDCRDRTR